MASVHVAKHLHFPIPWCVRDIWEGKMLKQRFFLNSLLFLHAQPFLSYFFVSTPHLHFLLMILSQPYEFGFDIHFISMCVCVFSFNTFSVIIAYALLRKMYWVMCFCCCFMFFYHYVFLSCYHCVFIGKRNVLSVACTYSISTSSTFASFNFFFILSVCVICSRQLVNLSALFSSSVVTSMSILFKNCFYKKKWVIPKAATVAGLCFMGPLPRNI